MVGSGSSTPKSRLVRWWEALTPLSRLLAIALAAPLTVLNAWAFSEIFGYFRSLFIVLLTAALSAFLLNYPVRWLEKGRIKRGQAAILVFLAAILIVLALGVTLVPLAFTQAQQLVARLPEWIDSGRRQLVMLDERISVLGLPISLDGLAAQLNARLTGELQGIAGQTLNLALNLTVFTVVRLLDILLTVVLTFYLLQNSHAIWSSLIGWLPARLQQPFSRTLRLSFQNYFFGQIISATCMGLGLTSAFLLDGARALWRHRWNCVGDAARCAAKHWTGISAIGCCADRPANCRKLHCTQGLRHGYRLKSVLGVYRNFGGSKDWRSARSRCCSAHCGVAEGIFDCSANGDSSG
jgi:hypothetical protein